MQPIDILTIQAIAKRESARAVKDAADTSLAALAVTIKGDDGRDGIDGRDGRDGVDGKDGNEGNDGRDGKDGRDGIGGDRGDQGPRGNDGANGRDGISIRDVYVDPDDGDLYVELTNSRLINAGHVKGKDGKPGKDGRNGVIVGGGGSSGTSLPSGGTTGQVLAKLSNADQDVSWQTVSGLGGDPATWGTITGTLSAQTDLQTALNGKATTAQGMLADTALQADVIGVSVQGYSAVLAATTASYTTAEQSKLAGIAAGATVNSSDATLLARANHTGTQLAATISDFNTAADARVVAGITGKQDTLVSGTNIKTFNGSSLLGSGDLVVSGGGGSGFNPVLSWAY